MSLLFYKTIQTINARRRKRFLTGGPAMKKTMDKPEEIFVLDRRVRLLQPPGGFRTSLDSVLLAAACPAADGDRILDMGAGVGGAAFCLLARLPQCHVIGVEIQAYYHKLALRNITLNDAEGRAEFVVGDVLTYQAARFDHVICNPPYLDAGTYTPSPDAGRALALGHGADEKEDGAAALKDWIDAAFRLLQSRGSLTLIHRADQLDKIFIALGRRFGAVEIIPLWPHAGEAAKRVIVRAVKDRRSPAILHPGIVLHQADGTYTPQAEAYLRGGQAI